MPHFVILEHDHPHLHWDLMLEAGAVLRTWRLEAFPGAGKVVGAEASFDHRLAYLDYEGPISGNRGTVRRWDAGTFTQEADTPEEIVVDVQGNRLRGRLVLRPLSSERWTVQFVGEDRL